MGRVAEVGMAVVLVKAVEILKDNDETLGFGRKRDGIGHGWRLVYITRMSFR